jgi:ABC-type dipeptide/oligopeptide/nickel transport system permease subunit
MRIVDAGVVHSLPHAGDHLSVILHPDTGVMIFIIAVIYWLGVARLVRGETLTLRTREYVQAVKVAGGRSSGTSCRTRQADHRAGDVRGGRLHPAACLLGFLGPFSA